MQPVNYQTQTDMDIVNRIKSFMNANGIGSTQFADACRIPRPTLSQILSGRNKKISDEVISKIHEAYPQLSVLWLLFGEGDMISRSGAQPSPKPQQPAPEAPEQPSRASAAPFGGFHPASNVGAPPAADDETGLFGSDALIFDDDTPMTEAEQISLTDTTAEPSTVKIPADGSKAIVNIMVFYSDNSYQSFVPR